MAFFRQCARMMRIEWRLVMGHPKWWGTLWVLMCVPAVYLLIYLSSMWDPASRSQALRVGVLNLDRGHTYRDQTVNMGADLVVRLMQKGDFGYFPLAQAEQAKARVRSGELAFAVIIPPDFSALALPGRMADEGRLEVHASAGNNYQTYLIAKKFAEDLDVQINQTLNQQRWRFVLASGGAQGDLLELRTALGKIHQGTTELSTGLTEAAKAGGRLNQGSHQLGDEVNKLTSGTQQLGLALRSMESSLPPVEDVRRLRLGAEDLAQGHQDLGKALGGLHTGSQKLIQGVEQFRESQPSVPFFSSALNEALDPLQTGLNDLRDGLFKTQQAQRQLAQGADALRDGVRTLVFGVRDMRAGLRQMVSKWPEGAALQQLGTGAQELAQSQGQLAQGLNRLREGSVYLASSTQWLMQRVPTEVQLIDGSPEGLSHSVATELKVEAAVSHLGAAMVPSVIPVALWLGASIAIFLVRGRHVAWFARRYHSLAKVLAKAWVPSCVVWAQCLLLLALLLGWFQLQIAHLWPVMALMFCAGASFVAVLLLFIRVAGDAGKALAMLLLALQISASGGVVPIELSGEFFSALSPWLPMTWMVQGLKAAMFGAYGGDWSTPFWQTLGLGLGAVLLASVLGRWQHVRASRLRPALDL
ncbi:MAG: hypothetical protein RIT26_1817 [Pseudomonadota bacterium]